MQRISADIGVPIIEAFEGCLKPVPGTGQLTTYYCPAGVLTIGYGHTNLAGVPPKVAPGMRLSRAECEAALAADVQKFEARVGSILKGLPLDQHQFDALVSFDFNTGGLDRSSIPAKIKAGRLDEVPETLSRWNKAGGKVLAGLTRRRKAEGELFAGKVEDALRTAGTARASGPMPQTADRPSPTGGDVAARAKEEIGIAGAGGVAAGSGTLAPDKPGGQGSAPMPALVGGLVLLMIGLVLLYRKYRLIARDWA